MWPFRRKRTLAPARAGTYGGLNLSPLDLASTAPLRVKQRRLMSWRTKFKLFIVAPAIAGIVLTAAAGLLFVHYSMTFPDPLSLRHKERAPVIRILAADGSNLAERGAAHDYMPLDLLPRHIIDAVVATEDRRFFEHSGLDPFGLVRAMFANVRAGRYAQGGSTLTQQLAKNLFLNSERTLSRKLEELALALWLEMRLGKADIMELYLNRVYFGAGAYGIEAAAQRYFDKSARALTLGEAAVIAGLLKAPSKYSPLSNPGAARTRARVVLKKMLAAGLISPEAEVAATRNIVKFASMKPGKDLSGVEYAVDFILERLPPLLGNGHAEVIVETTIDAKLQRRAQATVERVLDREGEAAQASQASVVVLDTEGGIAALVGGRSYLESQFNRAVKSRRQPGSSFKPFVYLAALEAGMTPDSTVYDLPVSIAGWSPRNDNGQYRGAVTMRQGLSQSINTVAVRLQYDIGVKRIVAVAQRLGVISELRPGPSLALGTSEVSLLEITGAYTAFANSGRRIDPHIIKRVRISSGRVLYIRPPVASQVVIAPVHVGSMNDMLNAALVTGTGRRAALSMHPAAGKTGTTQDFRDAWFIGYTAHLAGGVWVGNDHGRTMNNVRGGSLPAVIWREIMTAAHEGRSVLALPGTASSVPHMPRDPPVAARFPVERSQPVPGSKPQEQQGATTASAQARSPLQPRERIEAEFISRMLAEGKAADQAAAVPQFTPDVPEDRPFPRFAPQGIMSLGAKQP
jgi:penicillin-binding protein 1A